MLLLTSLGGGAHDLSDLVDDVARGGRQLADAAVEGLVQAGDQVLDVADELLRLAEGLHHLHGRAQLVACGLHSSQQVQVRTFSKKKATTQLVSENGLGQQFIVCFDFLVCFVCLAGGLVGSTCICLLRLTVVWWCVMLFSVVCLFSTHPGNVSL